MVCNACLNVCTDLSTRPFIARRYAANIIWRIPLDLTNAWNSSDRNCEPLSPLICSEIPNLAKKASRTSGVVPEVVQLTEITYSHLLCASKLAKALSSGMGWCSPSIYNRAAANSLGCSGALVDIL